MTLTGRCLRITHTDVYGLVGAINELQCRTAIALLTQETVVGYIEGSHIPLQVRFLHTLIPNYHWEDEIKNHTNQSQRKRGKKKWQETW